MVSPQRLFVSRPFFAVVLLGRQRESPRATAPADARVAIVSDATFIALSCGEVERSWPLGAYAGRPVRRTHARYRPDVKVR
jgi:hypothetical protein